MLYSKIGNTGNGYHSYGTSYNRGVTIVIKRSLDYKVNTL